MVQKKSVQPFVFLSGQDFLSTDKMVHSGVGCSWTRTEFPTQFRTDPANLLVDHNFTNSKLLFECAAGEKRKPEKLHNKKTENVRCLRVISEFYRSSLILLCGVKKTKSRKRNFVDVTLKFTFISRSLLFRRLILRAGMKTCSGQEFLAKWSNLNFYQRRSNKLVLRFVLCCTLYSFSVCLCGCVL